MRTIYDGDRADICTLNCVGDVIFCMLASRALDRGLEPQSGQTKDCVSGQYGGLGMITRPIWKCPCINLYLFNLEQTQRTEIPTATATLPGALDCLTNISNGI